MKWITRENVGVDRIACAWLIKKFIDPFLYELKLCLRIDKFFNEPGTGNSIDTNIFSSNPLHLTLQPF